ncbi:MAG TPA: hypothetical protein PLZ08_06875 [Bacillota bacterium]|nr:hypothetical protein [Bacillota bacterium]HOL09445.1 hypothetical protein [Bacillota bacterium]HPO97667.1 hypothetical protein [Bacillota bacterium]
MKHIKMLFVLGCVLLLVGFSGKGPIPMEGVYNAQLRTYTYFDLVALAKHKLITTGKPAELTESKPDELQVEFDINNLKQPLFGVVKLGNGEQPIWFVMGQDDDQYYSEIYFDRNLDNRITENEKVKGVQTFDGKNKSLKVKYAFSMIPTSATVVYKGESDVIRKKLYFFIFAQNISNKNQQTETAVEFYTASFLDGEMKVQRGKELKIVRYRITDIDGNGCFNDYGKDIIAIDANLNGVFEKSEYYPLTEYFDYVDDSKQKQQLRMVVLPMPSKIAVTGVTTVVDRLQLEAVSDKAKDEEAEDESNNGKTEAENVQSEATNEETVEESSLTGEQE